MAEVELGWFRRRFAGLDVPRRYQTELVEDFDDLGSRLGAVCGFGDVQGGLVAGSGRGWQLDPGTPEQDGIRHVTLIRLSVDSNAASGPHPTWAARLCISFTSRGSAPARWPASSSTAGT